MYMVEQASQGELIVQDLHSQYTVIAESAFPGIQDHRQQQEMKFQ